MIKIVQKVWGREEWIVNDDLYCGKRMILKKGFQCSLHRHRVKRETFYVQSGEVRMQRFSSNMEGVMDDPLRMLPGDSVTIEPWTWHRFAGLRDSVIFEFSTHHDDADVERAAGEESRAMT